jgi:hypothetical protein
MFQPINIETVDQAQQRQDRADAAQEATGAQAIAANSNVAAGLVDELKRLRPHAIGVAACQLETASIVAKLEDGREVVVDLDDIRKALAADATIRSPALATSDRWRWRIWSTPPLILTQPRRTAE